MEINRTYPIRQILGREDPAQALLVIDNKDTVRALCRTELTGVRDGDALRHGERRAGLERRDSALLDAILCAAASAAAASRAIRRRDGAFARELAFDLFADCLWETDGVSVSVGIKISMVSMGAK